MSYLFMIRIGRLMKGSDIIRAGRWQMKLVHAHLVRFF